MDDVVTIEYRGMQGELAVGDTLIVESSEPGVLRLRRKPKVAAPAAPKRDSKGKTDA